MATKEEIKIKKINLRRRKFVNKEFKKATKGKSLSQDEKTDVLQDAWDEAKIKFK